MECYLRGKARPLAHCGSRRGPPTFFRSTPSLRPDQILHFLRIITCAARNAAATNCVPHIAIARCVGGRA